MSNSIKEMRIFRSSTDHHYEWLLIEFDDVDDLLHNVVMNYATNNNEDEAVIQLFDEFVEKFSSDYLTNTSLEQFRLKITQGFDQLRENDLSGNSYEIMKIPVVSKEQTK